MIDSQRGTWSLSQRGLLENWPALYDEFRRRGNRLLRPQDYLNPAATQKDVDMESVAWDYLASRVDTLSDACWHHYHPSTNGYDFENSFSVDAELARKAQRNGDWNTFENTVVEALSLFSRVCRILGMSARGPGRMYNEALEVARVFAPLAAEISSLQSLFLLESVFNMSGGDIETLNLVLDSIPPNSLNDLYQSAFVQWQTQGSPVAGIVAQILA